MFVETGMIVSVCWTPGQYSVLPVTTGHGVI